jgi:hypothetical protein
MIRNNTQLLLRGFMSLVALLLVEVSGAQREPDNVLIYKGAEGKYQPCEPSIAVSPKNPMLIVAGSI